MRRLSRSALLAAVALAACAPLAPGPSRALTAAPPRTRGLPDLVPSPSEALLVVDVARLRASPWSRPVFAWARERQRTATGRQGLRGFDEIDDVDRWVFARLASRPGAPASDTLELAEGRFQSALVESAFRSRRPEARREARAGAELLTDGERAVALVGVGQRRAVLGPAASVTAALAVVRGEQPAATEESWLAAALTALEDEAGARRSDVAVELALLLTEPLRAELAGWFGRAPRVQQLAARLALSSDVRAVLVAAASDRQEARFLADRLRETLRALARRRSVRALGLGPTFERAEVTARGARLVVAVAVTEAERELVTSRLSELAAILGGPPPEADPPAEVAPGPPADQPPSSGGPPP